MGIQMNFDWIQAPSDDSICDECETLIVTEKMWRMIAFVDYEPIETKFKMCEACYAVKTQNGDIELP